MGRERVATVPVPVHLLALTPSVRAARPQTEEGAASVGARGGGLVAHYARTLGWRPEWTEGFPRDLFGARLRFACPFSFHRLGACLDGRRRRVRMQKIIAETEWRVAFL